MPLLIARHWVCPRKRLSRPAGGDKVTPGGIEFSDDQLARLKQAYTDQGSFEKACCHGFDPNREEFAGMSPEELERERQFYNENFRKYDNDALAKFNSPMSLRTGAVPRRVVMVVT